MLVSTVPGCTYMGDDKHTSLTWLVHKQAKQKYFFPPCLTSSFKTSLKFSFPGRDDLGERNRVIDINHSALTNLHNQKLFHAKEWPLPGMVSDKFSFRVHEWHEAKFTFIKILNTLTKCINQVSKIKLLRTLSYNTHSLWCTVKIKFEIQCLAMISIGSDTSGRCSVVAKCQLQITIMAVFKIGSFKDLEQYGFLLLLYGWYYIKTVTYFKSYWNLVGFK